MAAVNREVEIETKSNNWMLATVTFSRAGFSGEGRLMVGYSKKRATFFGLAPTKARVRYCKKKARPKVTRMAYSPGRSTWPVFMARKKRRSKMMPITNVKRAAPSTPASGCRPGNQSVVR